MLVTIFIFARGILALMYDIKYFSENLRKIRKKRWEDYKNEENTKTKPDETFACCKSLETFAEALNVERRTIGNWENGITVPPLDKVAEICNLLNCNFDNLFGVQEMVGFSPDIIAAHYSKINIDIIKHGHKDHDYRDFLNYFMHPDNCEELINSVTLLGWQDIIKESDLKDINEPLKSLVIKCFHRLQALYPETDYSIEGFNKCLLNYLSKDDFSFSKKIDFKKIHVHSCIPQSKFEELGLSNKNSNSYNLFIDYIANYSYDILYNKELLEIKKEKLGQLFVNLFEKYCSGE